jgi:hypothetical protein
VNERASRGDGDETRTAHGTEAALYAARVEVEKPI